jgi:hypothetical protein
MSKVYFPPASSDVEPITLPLAPSSVLGTAVVDNDTRLSDTRTPTDGSVTKNIAHRYPITLDAAGAVRSLGTLSLLATGFGGTSTIQAAVSWKAIR